MLPARYQGVPLVESHDTFPAFDLHQKSPTFLVAAPCFHEESL